MITTTLVLFWLIAPNSSKLALLGASLVRGESFLCGRLIRCDLVKSPEPSRRSQGSAAATAALRLLGGSTDRRGRHSRQGSTHFTTHVRDVNLGVREKNL